MTGPSKNFDSVNTDKAELDSLPASYHVQTDGSTIDALPQRGGLGTYTGESDIGPLLETLIESELPPSGSIKEAAGKILLKRGNYPGDLSNGTYTGVPLPTTCHVVGETNTHFNDNPTSAVPATEPGVWLSFSSRGFFGPNLDTDFLTYPRLADVTLDGPGTSSGTGLDDNNSNPWDWAHFDRVVVQNCASPVHSTGDAMVNFYGCQFRKFGGFATLRTRKYLNHSTFATSVDGAKVRLENARMENGGLHGVGEANPFVLNEGGAEIEGVRFEKIGGTNGNGTAVRTVGDGKVSGRVVGNEGDWNAVVEFDGAGEPEANIDDDSASTNTYSITTNATFPHINGGFENGVNGAGKANPIFGDCYSVNQGNPNATGGWNGNERRGVVVEDYSNNLHWAYLPNRSAWMNFEPRGPFDLGSRTGDFDGQSALSNGTTATNSHAVYSWDDTNSQWVRADGGATV